MLSSYVSLTDMTEIKTLRPGIGSTSKCRISTLSFKFSSSLLHTPRSLLNSNRRILYSASPDPTIPKSSLPNYPSHFIFTPFPCGFSPFPFLRELVVSHHLINWHKSVGFLTDPGASSQWGIFLGFDGSLEARRCTTLASRWGWIPHRHNSSYLS